MIIHLTGPDTYRSAKRLAELRSAFITRHDPRQLNVVQLDGETIASADLHSAVAATGMFSTKRFVTLDHYHPANQLPLASLQSELVRQADKAADVIVVVRDTLDDVTGPIKRNRTAGKKKTTPKKINGPFTIPGEKREIFSLLTPAQMMKWITDQATTRGGLIETAAAQRLIVLCASDSWRIATELEKLLTYAGSHSVTTGEVESMVISENNSDMFALTDALGQRQADRALDLLHREFSAGTNEFSLIASLAGHIRTLYYVKQSQVRGTAPAAMAAELGLHPFVVKKAASQAPRFSSTELRDLHHQLLMIDHDLKTSRLDAETLLGLVMVKR